MSEREQNGTVAYRLSDLDRRVSRIESLEPAVMKQQIQDIRVSVSDIRKDTTWVKRTLTGFLIALALNAVLLTLLLTRGKSS